jgi:hypothetical protein
MHKRYYYLAIMDFVMERLKGAYTHETWNKRIQFLKAQNGSSAGLGPRRMAYVSISNCERVTFLYNLRDVSGFSASAPRNIER